MTRNSEQRLDLFIVGIIGVLVGALMIIGILTVFEMSGNDYGFLRTKNVYINGSETYENIVFSVLEKNKDSVLHISASKSLRSYFGTAVSTTTGSGFILSEDGYIATNNHVVSDSDKIIATLYDGKVYDAELVGTDTFNDIAVIKIDADNLVPVELGNSDEVRQGELVFALGSPFQLQNTITSGIASGVNRKIEFGNGFEVEHVIQTDTAINPGNSGGPLLNSEGQVIGVNTAIISASGGSEGIGFAVPINTVKRITNEIIDIGKVLRPWFGIIGTSIDYRISNLWNLSTDHGVIILDFDEHGNAKTSGLRKTESTPEKDDFVLGDIITKLDEEKIDTMDDFINTLMKYRPGDTVKVEYFRAGKNYTVFVELEEKKE